jgi:hypothetical protein
MPNHCENDIYIYGPKSEINAFFKAVKTDQYLIDADRIIPYPAEFKALDDLAKAERAKGNWKVTDGYNSGGYDWCINNWGTKWGMYDFSPIRESKRGVKVSCQSAWSPPLPLILEASKQFPKLRFKVNYFEGGVGFKGVYECKAGEVLDDTESKYSGKRGG